MTCVEILSAEIVSSTSVGWWIIPVLLCVEVCVGIIFSIKK